MPNPSAGRSTPPSAPSRCVVAATAADGAQLVPARRRARTRCPCSTPSPRTMVRSSSTKSPRPIASSVSTTVSSSAAPDARTPRRLRAPRPRPRSPATIEHVIRRLRGHASGSRSFASRDVPRRRPLDLVDHLERRTASCGSVTPPAPAAARRAGAGRRGAPGRPSAVSPSARMTSTASAMISASAQRARLADQVAVELEVLAQPAALLPLVAEQLRNREPANRLPEPVRPRAPPCAPASASSPGAATRARPPLSSKL